MLENLYQQLLQKKKYFYIIISGDDIFYKDIYFYLEDNGFDLNYNNIQYCETYDTDIFGDRCTFSPVHHDNTQKSSNSIKYYYQIKRDTERSYVIVSYEGKNSNGNLYANFDYYELYPKNYTKIILAIVFGTLGAIILFAVVPGLLACLPPSCSCSCRCGKRQSKIIMPIKEDKRITEISNNIDTCPLTKPEIPEKPIFVRNPSTEPAPIAYP